MIKSIADLLKEFIKAEVKILNEQNIKHPTTIGSMFEGLTKSVLDQSIFHGLNLKVSTNSFIKNCQKEFDVLLTDGEGERVPFTNRFIYNPEQIIAIIQVKKNIYSKDLKEGYENLKYIIDYYESSPREPFIGRLFRDSFRGICKKDVTAKDGKELSYRIFGEDLDIQPHNRFLDCRFKQMENFGGWEYDYFAMNHKSLVENIEQVQWEPVFIDNAQHVIIAELCKEGEVDLGNDNDLESFVIYNEYKSIEEFIEKLKLTGLVYIENNKLKLLTDKCQCAFLPDGRIAAGENKSGRFTRWLNSEIAKKEKNNLN